jgi:2,3-bisphosphoglycerate-dependent phosphoglycerate mutase
MAGAPKSQPEEVTGAEILELFRKAIRREVKIVVLGKSWKDVYAGDVRFRIGDYLVVIFNDCNELDYADSATAPDGRRGDFDDWSNANAEPVSLLTKLEFQQLENLLESAPVVEDGQKPIAHIQ